MISIWESQVKTCRVWTARAIRALALVVIVPGAVVFAIGGLVWMGADRLEHGKRPGRWWARPMGG
jgi:hypothetical protein